MRIATWNVNSIKARLPIVCDWLRSFSPDVLLVQETKTIDETFPRLEIEDIGYNILHVGQKTYNGVAILSKHPMSLEESYLSGDEFDLQARYIEALITPINQTPVRVASVYVPNGQDEQSEKFEYKLNFFDRLHKHLQKLLEYEEITVIGGDYNVAPEEIDVYDPKKLDGTVCFHPLEREKFRRFLHSGYYDAFRIKNPDKHTFSWWNYREGSWQYDKGMRIDHLLLSPQAVDKLNACDIDKSTRALPKASDHTPVWCELNLKKYL